MATIPDALIATWTAQWTGVGGTIPTLYNYEDLTMNPPDDEDYIVVRDFTQDTNRARVNDETADYEYDIQYIVNTAEDVAATNRGDRLKEITDEAERIIHEYPITGASFQEMLRTRNISGESRLYWRNHVFIKITAKYVDSATAWGTNVSPSVIVVDELTVNDWLKVPLIKSADGTDTIELLAGEATFPNPVNIEDELVFGSAILHSQASNFHMHPASGNADIILALHPLGTNTKSTFQCRNAVSPANFGALEFSIDGATGSIIFVQGGGGTPPTKLEINGYDHAEALMLGDANAAWVPLGIMGGQFHVRFYITAGKMTNVGGDDYNATWNLPKECLKGSLKLHIKNLKIGVVDADSDDFITQTTIYGVNGITVTQLDIDGTDHKTIGDKTFAGAVMPAAAIDVSGYESVLVQLSHTATGAGQGDTANLRMECYYDT